MNYSRFVFLSKLIKNTQCLNLSNSHRLTTAIEPVKNQTKVIAEIAPELPNTDITSQMEQLDELPKHFSPTFNFAAYVNKSESLQRFVELGVDLSKLEKRRGIPQFVMKLDFEKDVKKVLLFLNDLGLPADYFGEFITKNPLIFKESIEDLETRVYYMRSKKFTPEMVKTVVAKNPFWLSFSTKRIDGRLGWFQRNFKLQGSDIRFLTVKAPRLITYKLEHIRVSTFKITEEMGFDKDEVKVLLLAKPNLWMHSE